MDLEKIVHVYSIQFSGNGDQRLIRKLTRTNGMYRNLLVWQLPGMHLTLMRQKYLPRIQTNGTEVTWGYSVENVPANGSEHRNL